MWWPWTDSLMYHISKSVSPMAFKFQFNFWWWWISFQSHRGWVWILKKIAVFEISLIFFPIWNRVFIKKIEYFLISVPFTLEKILKCNCSDIWDAINRKWCLCLILREVFFFLTLTMYFQFWHWFKRAKTCDILVQRYSIPFLKKMDGILYLC